MRFLLLSAFLMILPLTAMAQDKDNVQIIRRDTDRVIELPGNATVVTGDNDNNVYIKRRYGTSDLIYNRFYNPNPRYRPSPNVVPANNINALCSGAEKQSERRECRREAQEQYEEIYKKYND